MIKKRVTVYCKLAILWLIMGFSENYTVRAPNVALMISTKTQAENDDSEASESNLQIRHGLVGNEIQREFYRKSSKLSVS